MSRSFVCVRHNGSSQNYPFIHFVTVIYRQLCDGWRFDEHVRLFCCGSNALPMQRRLHAAARKSFEPVSVEFINTGLERRDTQLVKSFVTLKPKDSAPNQ
jgi:hypothetical protein